MHKLACGCFDLATELCRGESAAHIVIEALVHCMDALAVSFYRAHMASPFNLEEQWCDASASEFERFLRDDPRLLEARPPLTQTKVNYREWSDPSLGAWPANGVAKSWKRGRRIGYQVRQT